MYIFHVHSEIWQVKNCEQLGGFVKALGYLQENVQARQFYRIHICPFFATAFVRGRGHSFPVAARLVELQFQNEAIGVATYEYRGYAYARTLEPVLPFW